MAYQSLYRKYRPQTFSDVVGQGHVTRTIQNALASGRIAHGYLFTGTRGTAKTTVARLLAKALNCEAHDRPTAEPCNQCDACKSVTAGSCIDVIEMDAASHRGVADIEEVRKAVGYGPMQFRYKVFIIDEAHQLSSDAKDAFLKTLEEPPANVVFILATTEPQAIPITIRSRCQQFDFKRGSLAEISARLKYVLDCEGVTYAPDALALVARGAEGSYRDSLSLLEQVLAFAPRHITAADVDTVLGTLDSEQLARVTHAVARADAPGVFVIAGDLLDAGKEARTLLRALSGHFRDLLLVSVGGPAVASELTPDEVGLLQQEARLFTPQQLMHAMDVVNEGLSELRWNNQHRLLIELTFLKLMTLGDEQGKGKIFATAPIVFAPALPASHAFPPPAPMPVAPVYAAAPQVGPVPVASPPPAPVLVSSPADAPITSVMPPVTVEVAPVLAPPAPNNGGAEGSANAVALASKPSEAPLLLGAGGATADDEVLPPGFFASGEDETENEDALDDDMFGLGAAEEDPDAPTPPVVETALPVAESASEPVAVAADASLFLFDEEAESDADDAEAVPEPDLTPGLFEDEPVFSNQLLAEEIAPPVEASPLAAPPAPVLTSPVSAFASPAPSAPPLVSAFAAPPAPVADIADASEGSHLGDDEAEDVAPVAVAAPIMRAATPDEELDALLGSAPPPEEDSDYAPHEMFGAPAPVQSPSFAASVVDAAPPRPLSPSLVAAPLFDDDEIEDVAAVRVTLDQVIQAWPQFMSEAARISKRVSVMMGAAQPTDVRGKVVTITMGDRANFEMMSQPKQLDFIRKLLARSLSVESVGVKFVVAGNAPPPPVKIENANKKKRSDPLERLANLDREPLAPITSDSNGYASPESYGAITGGRGSGDNGAYAPPARPALPASAFAASAPVATAPPVSAFAAAPPPVIAPGNGYQNSPASFASPPARETYAPAPAPARAFATAAPDAYGAPPNAVNGDARMAEALAHPLVQEALEKFGGEIVFD